MQSVHSSRLPCRHFIVAGLLGLSLAGSGASATELQDAAKDGDTAAVFRLLALGIHTEERDSGDTPLFTAAAHDRRDVAAQLLAAGAQVDSVNALGRTPLHAARESVAPLLLAWGADANARDVHGLTPLHLAAQRGWLVVAEVLLQAGAGVNARDQHGGVPLHEAQPELARLLLSWGAEVDARDDRGERPLHRAVVRGDGDTIALLLALGATPDPRDAQGSSPLHGAVIHGDPALASELLGLGAVFDQADQDGRTPLGLGLRMGRSNPVTGALRSLGQE
jgi:ankyrin repeat protein